MHTLGMDGRRLTGLCAAILLLAGCDNGAGLLGNAPPGTSPGTAPGNTFAITSSGRLVSFDRAAPALATAVNVTGLASGETLLGIDFRPGGTPAGELYALTSTGRLYTIDTGSGVAALKSTLSADPADTTDPFTALSGTEYGVDFNPVVDGLRIISDTGLNLRVNVDTGATLTDGTLNTAGTTRGGVVDAAYTNSFAAACRTTLFFIDANTDRLLTTADPNAGTLTDVGALGADASAIGGYEIVTAPDGSSSAIAAFTVGGTPTLYSIDLSTGASTAIGAVTGLNSNEQLRGLAVAPPTGTLVQAIGQAVAVTETGRLISFNTASPQKLCTSTTITGLQDGEAVLGVDTRPADAALYLLGSAGRLYTVDPATAAATVKSTLVADPTDMTDPFTALDGADFGVDFNPVPDRLRVVSNTGQNLRINADTGETTTDSPLTPAGSTAVAAAYTSSFAGAGSTTLYVIDSSTDQLLIQGQPSGNPNNGDLQAVGALGIDLRSVASFDISGANNGAFVAVNLSGAATSELHSLNLATGAATRVNTIGGGERACALALLAVPVATVFGTTTDGRLVSFRPGTPGAFETDLPVSGLQGGESIIGVDFRQANGKLYAATDAGRVYTVNPVTAAATIASTLAADSADTTNPFVSLGGGTFSVDFNPVADRLRIVGDAGQNLRIDVDSGLVTTDGVLNPGIPQIVAAAYTQSFPGTMATQLLDIDLATNSLLVQNPPNDGTLAPVGGVLDPALTFSTIAGFDIGGGADGLAVSALQPTGSAQSVLYRVNLTTGALTPVGAIGPTGTPLIRALAIRVQ